MTDTPETDYFENNLGEAAEMSHPALWTFARTPVRWHSHYSGNPDLYEIQYGEDGECVAEVVNGAANAQLIAAAPKMLEALQFYAAHMKRGYEITDSGQVAEDAIREALALPNAIGEARADNAAPPKPPTQ